MATGGLSAMVRQAAFAEPVETLAHNIPDLLVSVGDAEVDCDFLTYYRSTGGLTRWGFATSEVIAERPDGLTQYYQRGIVDCQERDGVWRMERRLVWDYVGGGLGDAPDQGTEPDLLSEQIGLPLGPWGHSVSNFAVGRHRRPASLTSSIPSAACRPSAIPRPRPASTMRPAPCSALTTPIPA